MIPSSPRVEQHLHCLGPFFVCFFAFEGFSFHCFWVQRLFYCKTQTNHIEGVCCLTASPLDGDGPAFSGSRFVFSRESKSMEIQSMDRFLHLFEAMVEACLLVFTGEPNHSRVLVHPLFAYSAGWRKCKPSSLVISTGRQGLVVLRGPHRRHLQASHLVSQNWIRGKAFPDGWYLKGNHKRNNLYFGWCLKGNMLECTDSYFENPPPPCGCVCFHFRVPYLISDST